MYRKPCPPSHRWSALLADDLPPAEQADLNGHLELCPACQRTLEECAADRDDWAAARTLAAMTQPRSAVLGDVIDCLKLDPESDHAHNDGAELPVDFLDPSLRAGIIGRIHQYEVLEEIGRGGMGVVLKALDPGLHRVVAIKVLAPQLAVSGTARKRFTREARAAAAIGHENVVTIHAVEEFKGLPYLVMQYVAGPSVQQKIAADGPLPVADVLRIGFQTAAGLAAAHAQGLIHRDVKPANILLENGVGRVKLTDFSLARAIDDASVTQSGVVTGTPPFMAPEQARGEPLDHRADLFSLGSVLYALCTGRPPFRGQALDVLRKVSEEQPVSIRTLNPEIPTWLESIVNKLMAKNPDDRYQSAGEVAAVLEQCLAHVQQPNTITLPAIPSGAKRKRHWLETALPILAVVVVAAVLIVRVKTAHGTLEVTVEDPAATVTVENTDIVVSGLQGMKEFRLKAGDYTVHETKAGKPEKTEIVSITRDAKTPLRVTFEADRVTPPAIANAATQIDDMLRRLSAQRKAILQLQGSDNARVKEVDDRIAELERLRATGPKVNQSDVSTALLKAAVDRANAARATADAADDRALHAERLAAAGQAPQSVAKIARAKADSARQLAVVAEEEAKVYRQRVGKIEDRTTRLPLDNATADTRELAVEYDRLEQMLLALRKQKNDYLENLGPNNPRVKELDARIDEIQRMNQRRADFARAGGDQSAAALVAELDQLKTLLKKARADAETAKAELAATKDFLMKEMAAAQKSTRPSVTQPQRNFPTSAGEVSSAVFSGDGKTLFVADWNGSVYAYEFATGKVRFTVAAGKSGGSRFLAVSPDSKFLVGVGSDLTIKFVDLKNGRVRQSLDGKCAPYYAVAFSPDGKTLAAGGCAPDGRGGLLELWDLKSGKVKTADFSDPVYSLAFPREVEDRLAVGTGSENVRMIYPSTAKVEYSLGQPDTIRAMAFSPDGQRLAASSDNQIHVWEWGSSHEVAVLRGSSSRVTTIQFSRDGKRLLAANLDGTARLWDARSYKGLQTFAPGTYKRGMGVALLTPDGKSVVTAGDDGQIRVWDLYAAGDATAPSDGAPFLTDIPIVGDLFQKRIAAQRQAADAALADAQARYATAVAADVKARESQPNRTLDGGRGGPITSAAFTPDGRTLIVAGENRPVQEFDVRSEARRERISGRHGDPSLFAISPDGKELAFVDGDHSIRFWDLEGHKASGTELSGIAAISAIAFAPDGKSLAIGGRTEKGGGVLKVWERESGNVRVVDFPAPVLSLAFVPDNPDRLAVGLDGESVRIVDAANAREMYSLQKPGPIEAVAFSPDGHWLAASSGNQVDLWNSARDWRGANHRGTDALTGHTDRVTSIRFSPTGLWIATASTNGTARLWDARTHKLAARFAPNAGRLNVAEFSPDGKWLVTAGEDRTIRMWDLTATKTETSGGPGLPGGSGAADPIRQTTPPATPAKPTDPIAARVAQADGAWLRDMTVPANHANQCMACHQSKLPEDHGHRQPACYPDPKPLPPRP
jgi:WD40 repeat protein